MTARFVAAPSLALIAALSAGPARAAEATPQRPSLGFSAATVPDRGWELEAGGWLAEGTASLPLFLKYGWSDRTELELGLDAVRSVETDDGVTASAGDLFLGIRSRMREGARARLALAGWVKVPTAVGDVGSQETDAGVIGILSSPIGPLGLDANLWISGIGQPDDTILGQIQAIAAVGSPITGCWSSYLEGAWQTTASGGGSGGFVNAGVSCATTPGSVLDAAIGFGRSGGYPDWALTAGWTILLGGPS